jgi:energy-coupling factor transporter ATP-binding protein EcfA2
LRVNPFILFHETSKILAEYLPLGTSLEIEDIPELKMRRKRVDGEHYAIAGKTGSGKTYFSKKLYSKLAHKYRLHIYIVDSKKQGDFTTRDGRIIRSFSPPDPFSSLEPDIQIWQPVEDNDDMYSSFYNNILKAGIPAIVVTDETKNIMVKKDPPRGYTLLLTQGRLPGIHTISCTQEVAKAPRQMFSQASHICCFSLFNAYDENLMKRYLKIYSKKPLPFQGKHSMIYIQPDIDGEPKIFPNSMSFFNEW